MSAAAEMGLPTGKKKKDVTNEGEVHDITVHLQQ